MSVRPGGLAVVFEHNPYNPLTRRVVRNCEFDEGVRLLRAGEVVRHLRGTGSEIVEQRYLQFTPFDQPWARRLDHALGVASARRAALRGGAPPGLTQISSGGRSGSGSSSNT